jgi:hypothetical protein
VCVYRSHRRPTSPAARDVSHGDGDSFLLADQNHQFFASGHTGVEQIPL